MVNIATIIANSAMTGSVYALIAIGFTLIYGVRGVLNLAHGSLVMIGAFAFMISNTVLPNVGAFFVALLVAGLASMALYGGLVQFIEDNVVITFLSTIVVALIIQQVLTIQYSLAPRSLIPLMEGGLKVAGTRIRINQLLAFVTSWVALGLLYLFVTKTQLGRSILATSMTEKGAKLVGVDTLSVNLTTWFVAGALAGLAGVFLGNLQSTSPTMWINALGLAFIIVTIGGVGSITGSVVAAYLISTLETLTVAIIGPEWRGFFAFLLLVLVIIVRPEGLFGREFIE